MKKDKNSPYYLEEYDDYNDDGFYNEENVKSLLKAMEQYRRGEGIQFDFEEALKAVRENGME